MSELTYVPPAGRGHWEFEPTSVTEDYSASLVTGGHDLPDVDYSGPAVRFVAGEAIGGYQNIRALRDLCNKILEQSPV